MIFRYDVDQYDTKSGFMEELGDLLDGIRKYL